MVIPRSIIFLLIISATQIALAQDQQADPYRVIDSATSILEGIHDYQADIEVEVDVDFINMPVKHATLSYKEPDKFRIRSDEFIMLPKKGLGNRISRILEEPYTAIYLGEEVYRDQRHHLVRIVPMGKNPNVILATWWINSDSYLVSRAETTTRDEGSFAVDFIFSDPLISLPTEMIFSFEIEKLSLPLKFIGKSSGMEIDRTKMGEVNTGRVMIRFWNYRINSNLDDDIFIDAEMDDGSG